MKRGNIFALALAAMIAAKIAGMVLGGGNLQSGINFLRPVDDAYITFRYAANLAAGEGLAYNPGERVEGGSTFSFIVLLAGLRALGLRRIDLAAVMIGLAAMAGLISLAWGFMSTRRRQPPGLPEGFTMGFFTLGLATLVWAWSGMETPVLSLLIFAALLRHLQERKAGSWPIQSALLTVLAALTHPDAILVAVVAGLSWLIPFRRNDALKGVAYGALVTLLFGGYWLWRWRYFGYFFPNTYYAKAAGGGADLLKSGFIYLRVAFFSTLLPLGLIAFVHAGRGKRGQKIALALLALALAVIFKNMALPAALGFLLFVGWKQESFRAQPRWVWLFLGFGGIYSAFIVKVGGDFYPFHRFFMPILFPLGLVIWKFWSDACESPVRVSEEASEATEGKIRFPVLKVLLVLLAMNLWSYVYTFQGFIHSELQRVVRNFAAAGSALRTAIPRDASIATLPIGALGYFSEKRIHDMMGLVDTHIAHMELDTSRGVVGHEKFDHAYTLSARPEAVIVLPSLYRRGEAGLDKWVDENALAPTQYRIYEQPALKENYRLAFLPVRKNRGIYGFLRADLLKKPGYLQWEPLGEKETRTAFSTPARARSHPLHGKTFGIWSFK